MNELYHHGIPGQKWGVKNGPPYPLDARTQKKNAKTVNRIFNKNSVITYKNPNGSIWGQSNKIVKEFNEKIDTADATGKMRKALSERDKEIESLQNPVQKMINKLDDNMDMNEYDKILIELQKKYYPYDQHEWEYENYEEYEKEILDMVGDNVGESFYSPSLERERGLDSEVVRTYLEMNGKKDIVNRYKKINTDFYEKEREIISDFIDNTFGKFKNLKTGSKYQKTVEQRVRTVLAWMRENNYINDRRTS